MQLLSPKDDAQAVENGGNKGIHRGHCLPTHRVSQSNGVPLSAQTALCNTTHVLSAMHQLHITMTAGVSL